MTRCPPKIERMDRIHRELLDKMLHDKGTMISPRHGLVLETHRPLSVKQVCWIMTTIFGFYVSRSTLYKYTSWMDEEEKNNAMSSQPTI